MYLLNGAYEPTSTDVCAKKHIPYEAVYVRQQQAEILSAIDNLTLTFDGNTTRKPHSIYTAHATTPSRDWMPMKDLMSDIQRNGCDR